MFPKIFSFDTPNFLRGFLPDHIALYSYGFMIAIGVLVAFLFMRRRVIAFGIDNDKLSTLFIWGIIAAFIGGRLFFFLEDINRYVQDPSKMLRLSGGGFVFYGSVIFVIPTVIWWLRKHKVPVRPFLDIMAFVGPIVQAFGRIGCFMAGCCHGKVCNNFLGVTFSHPESMANPKNVALYPTQLFDIGINIIILFTLFYLQKRQKFAGQLMLVYLMMYAVGRSINELFRGDEERGLLFNNMLSHSQLIAIVMLAISILVWRRWIKKTEELTL